jgi:hypothetical protein
MLQVFADVTVRGVHQSQEDRISRHREALRIEAPGTNTYTMMALAPDRGADLITALTAENRLLGLQELFTIMQTTRLYPNIVDAADDVRLRSSYPNMIDARVTDDDARSSNTRGFFTGEIASAYNQPRPIQDQRPVNSYRDARLAQFPQETRQRLSSTSISFSSRTILGRRQLQHPSSEPFWEDGTGEAADREDFDEGH